MREYKFRGLGADGQWWYGEPTPQGERHVNLATFFANLHAGGINPETVGEYTGLKDKNGEEIYEGDILRYQELVGVVEYRHSGFIQRIAVNDTFEAVWAACEVIGNIFEHNYLVGTKTEK